MDAMLSCSPYHELLESDPSLANPFMSFVTGEIPFNRLKKPIVREKPWKTNYFPLLL